MDGPRDYDTNLSESERERQRPYAITYMWCLKYNTKADSETKYNTGNKTDKGPSVAWI